ncbi:hypothetical protein 2011_scaffold152_00032 [Bacteriophage sp.]|nr:hypothetical protein 2011_scaffold152_00032 [Bacteriophage sp.]
MAAASPRAIDAMTLFMIRTSFFSRIFSFSSASVCCFFIFCSIIQKQKAVTPLGILIAIISVCKSIPLSSFPQMFMGLSYAPWC